MAIFLRKSRKEIEQERADLRTLAAQIEQQRIGLRESIESDLAEEIGRVTEERVELERVRAALALREREADLMIRDRVRGFEHLAAAWAEWEFVQGERIAFDLLYKPRPALKAAEAVTAQARRSAELRRELSMAMNVLALYEYHYPWLVDFLADERLVEYVEADDYEAGKDDPARRFVARAEWDALPEVERHQLALDRWVRSRRANPWEAGADYESYVGYRREQAGWTVTYHGIEYGLEDLGRDVLARRDGTTEVIQCKRWGKRMGPIREKYVHQLVGTVASMRHDDPTATITGTFATTSVLSDTARLEAAKLGIVVEENLAMGDYPRIKCNVGGRGERIYHLPFDQQYDTTVIDPKRGETYVVTCAEAEAEGFRRAWKWRGNR
jgi:hypothetical protein